MKGFIKNNGGLISGLIGGLIFISVVRNCENEPKVKIETKTEVVTVHDTITKVKIDTIYTPVIIEKIKNVKGETKIVYIDTTTNTSIEAKKYDTSLKSNNAQADLQITTTGKLLDVQGIITYPKETITNTITKTKAKSGLFLYGQVPVNRNNINIEAGAIYQFKNSLMILGGVQYNQFTNSGDIKVGIGVKIF
jgi:hypothetical protein